ncbi:MAG: hypothetical protein ACD_11C00103G0026 [uncultured bacterium]|nr:MAG: hypothetical protein ACD_11C00103G0026 [uncultured bacterium]
MYYYIKTFGCQMNFSDSERIDSFMQNNGFQKPIFNAEQNLTPEILSQLNVFIINTCGIRQMAEDRVFGLVRNLKKDHPQIKIVITGCLANRRDVHKRMKGVDLFTEIKDFPEKVESIMKKVLSKKELAAHRPTLYSSNNKKLLSYFNIRPKYENKFTALVPIMTGCNNFCSYCVVPYARGSEVSRPANEIINEIKNLIKTGRKHIILLGQNVNSYNSPSPSGRGVRGEGIQKINFSKLLRKINALPGKFWISFVSSHPKDVTDEMITTVAQCKKVCENFHLPVQAGNDKVLQKMNRQYTASDYLKIIRKIKNSFKKHKPDCLFAITSDIIVGFPGETKKQFEDSASIMKKVKYDLVFFGQFSPRPGTAAWKMKDDVSKKEKERRMKYLNEILKKTALANNKKYIGKTIEVLIDFTKSENYFGKTRTGKNVRINSKRKNLVGKIIKVKITKANIWNLEGILP